MSAVSTGPPGPYLRSTHPPGEAMGGSRSVSPRGGPSSGKRRFPDPSTTGYTHRFRTSKRPSRTSA
ncbi:hypothetical protein ACFPRL_14140 [Pseudoclavibacter helvolus]